MVNMFTAGDNNREEVYSEDISILDSYYEIDCAEDEYRVTWEARNGEIWSDLELTELDSFTPRDPLALSFDWDDCGI